MYHALKKLPCLAALSLTMNLSHADETVPETRPMRYNGNAPKPEITPPARPIVRDGFNVFVNGEYLWWKAVQDDLEYVASVWKGQSTCINSSVNGIPTGDRLLPSYQAKEQAPSFEYSSGFRIGAGINTSYNGWDIVVNWTRLRTTADDKRCAFPCDRVTSASCIENTCRVGMETVQMGGCCVTGNDCGECNQCKFKCTKCFSNNAESCFCTNNVCCPTNQCGQCPKCCDKFDCDSCCAPVMPCCDVCFPCGCPTELFPLFSPLVLADQYIQGCAAAVDWQLNLDLLDGEIGREFFVSRHLTLRPFLSVRGAWLKQTFTPTYEFSINTLAPSVLSGNQFEGSFCGLICSGTKFRNGFQGVGPRAGLNSEWMIGGGFSLYSDAAIALLWGQFDIEARSNLTLCGEGTLNVTTQEGDTTQTENNFICINECSRFDLTNTFNTTKAVTDLGIGAQWQGTFARDRVALMIKIGWEQHMFFNQNQLDQMRTTLALNPIIPIPTPCEVNPINLGLSKAIQISNQPFTSITQKKRGDLSTQGLTVAFRLDF